MREHHPYIKDPDGATVIWRYIDLEKLIALLHARALHLCRIDNFRDPWEGSWPRSVVDGVRKNWQPGQGDAFLDFTKAIRAANYVSCWHASPTESAALWDLYAGKSGVAIRSTVASLAKSITDDKNYYIGEVHYVDNEPPPQLNMHVPTFLKRKSFEHEREIRVLHWDMPRHPEDVGEDGRQQSHALAIDPRVLIEALYIAPSSHQWLQPALQDLCRRYDLEVEVVRSSLYDQRVY